MWRALVFIGLLALAAFGAVWLADRPGNVVVNWGGYQAQTSVAVAAVLASGLAIAPSLLWGGVGGGLRVGSASAFASGGGGVPSVPGVPTRLSWGAGARRGPRGWGGVPRGWVGVGGGAPGAPRRHAGEAERLLGREPLTL